MRLGLKGLTKAERRNKRKKECQKFVALKKDENSSEK